MIDFPANPAHKQKLASDTINYWFDQNLPAWSRYEVTAAPPLSLNSLSPNTSMINVADFLLTAVGTSFVADCVIQVNGIDKTTTFVSATSLTTTMSAAGVAGTTPITVKSASLGKTTAPLNFTWTAAPFAFTSMVPATAAIGTANFLLTINGTGFIADCVIQVSGVAVTTAFVSATQLTTMVSTAGVTTAGTVPVAVHSPSLAYTTAPRNFTWTV